MTNSLPLRKATIAPMSFDVGPVRVTVFPSLPGQFARFLLHMDSPALPDPVLIASGSAHDIASCIAQAIGAARRLSVARP